ncbi:MAG TPA: acetate--CoA ligase family protein [Anaerolineae bacterium]|jgi:acyl-CoA synthetase (NDP forming)
MIPSGSSLAEGANTLSHRQDLTPLLKARSVAIVGISQPDRFGGLLFTNLRNFGYHGQIYGVNPRYESLFDQPCYPSLRQLPERPDCAILALPNHRLVEALQEAAELHIPAAVIFASAYSEPVDNQPSLQTRLAEIAQTQHMVICGPNCMGVFSLQDRLVVSGYRTNPDTLSGNVTFITHSGSVWEAFVQNRRGVAFNYIVSSGNEMVTSLADYMQFALTDPTTRVIGLFLETVRDPQTFTAALAEAVERDIPVVALKVGRSERGARLAQAHSGALAGEDAAYDALFAYYGVRRVKSPDELMDTLELFSTGLRTPTRCVSALLDSGGQRAMLVDLAEAEGVEFAPLNNDTQQKLAAVLEPGLDPVNPLDAWGTGNDYDALYANCLLALDADPATGLTLFAVDIYPTDDHDRRNYPNIVSSVLARLQKPLAWLVHSSAAASDSQVTQLRQMGIPILLGTENGLRAARHLLEYSEYQRRRTGEFVSKQAGELASRRVGKFADAHTLPPDEATSKQILQAYGLTAVTEIIAASLDEAIRAADEIGYPAVLKTAGDILHKSDRDGVRLNLADEEQLAIAYRDLETRLGPHVLVQQMITGGVELLLGLVNDPQFGPMLTLGSGGIWVEVLKDTRLLMLPVTPTSIRDALLSLRGASLLHGARGRPPVDLEAVVAAAMGLAALAADLGHLIAEVDINPLIALPDRAVMVDALIVPAE